MGRINCVYRVIEQSSLFFFSLAVSVLYENFTLYRIDYRAIVHNIVHIYSRLYRRIYVLLHYESMCT